MSARDEALRGGAVPDRRQLWTWLAAWLLPLVIIALFLLFALLEPRFLRGANLINLLRNASYLTVIATGQMLVLIIGGFDLSVGAVVALASVATALTMTSLLAAGLESVVLVIALGCLAGLAAGAVVGAVNGACVNFLKISPFMVTLGTMSVAAGVALYLTSGVPIYGMPDEFTRGFGRFRIAGIPFVIYLTFLILACTWVMMNRTVLGRYIYAIGGNPQATRNSGVSTDLYLIVTYTLCGLLAAVTGVLLTARVGSGEATLGGTLMLESIAAAVIGGVSLRGGVGRVELVALGALLLALVTNGLNLLRVDSKLQTIVVGVVLVLAVAIDALKHRKGGGG